MRMHEILGVEPGEVFEHIQEGIFYFVDSAGSVKVCPDKDVHNWRHKHAEGHVISSMINLPEGIIRKSRLSAVQIEVLKALKVLGCKWMAKDENGSCYGFTVKPMKSIGGWYGGNYVFADGVANSLSPLVSWSDPEPLNIVQTLKNAGVEV